MKKRAKQVQILKGFENLSLTQKIYIYCLSKATLLGRDIT